MHSTWTSRARCAAATLTLLSTFAPAHADTYQTVALPSDALNVDLRGWSDGGTYIPLFEAGSGTTPDGVPFLFTQNASGYNALYEYDAIDVPVGLSGVSTVYTLMNTAFGAPDVKVGSLTFSFTSGESFTVDLIEGLNIRDHLNGAYVNTVSDPSVSINVFGSPDATRAHFDMQSFTIPVALRDLTLSKLTFSSTHAGEAGQPFLAAVTVSAVPEAETGAMALVGLVFALACARPQRKAATPLRT